MTTDYNKEVIQFTPEEHKSMDLTMDWFAKKSRLPATQRR